MLFTSVTAAQKRQRFRESLRSGRLHQLPGAFNPLAAKLIEEVGFDGVYVSGAALSADLALPDVGLTTLSELTHRAHQIDRVTDLPTLADADTGFGEFLNVARTVQECEDAGLTGLHIEDQVNPKRCGHLEGKTVLGLKDSLRRIEAALEARRDPNFLIVARTDIAALEGTAAAAERARAFAAAGADAIFPEALAGPADFAAVREAVDVPLIANMTEFGKSELLSIDQLANVGIDIVLYPVTLLRAAMGAAEHTLRVIRRAGSQQEVVPDMLTRSRLYELIDYEEYTAFEKNLGQK